MIPSISTGASCGPSFYIPSPIDKTVRVPTPPESGCPGMQGWVDGRTMIDDAVGSVYGFRVAVRALLMLFQWVSFIFGFLRAMPWASKSDQLAPDLAGEL